MERQHRRAASARILYVRRAGRKRVLSNDREVSDALCGGGANRRASRLGADGGRGGHTRWFAECLALEGLTLTQQIRTIAASNVMVGVHGQAMAWMPFMLSEQSRAAVVEVLMPKLPGTKSVSNPRMYAHFASAMRINHTAIYGALVPECMGTRRDVLGCNVTVGVEPLRAALQGAVANLSAA